MNTIVLYLLAALFPVIAVSLLLICTGVTAIWSRDAERRARAERLFRLLVKAVDSRGRR